MLTDTLRRPLARTAIRPIPLIQMYYLWRSRRALARLDAARLSDIGLSVAQAQAEAQRSIWDVPAHWLR